MIKSVTSWARGPKMLMMTSMHRTGTRKHNTSSAIGRLRLRYAELLSKLAAALNPRVPYYKVKYGWRLWQSGKDEKALVEVEKALRLDSLYADGWLLKARILADVTKFDQAIEAYDRAIGYGLSNKKSTALAHYDKSLALQWTGKNREALQVLDRAIGFDSGNPSLYFEKARIFIGLEEPEKALKELDKGMALDDLNYEAWYHRGMALSMLDCEGEAVGAFKKAIECGISESTNESMAWNMLGCSLGALERFDEALDSFNRARELDPENLDASDNKARTLLELERRADRP